MEDQFTGASLLFVYSLGYVTPLLVGELTCAIEMQSFASIVGLHRTDGVKTCCRKHGVLCWPSRAAATATESLTAVMSLRKQSRWLTPMSGALLVSGGTYGLLTRLL